MSAGGALNVAPKVPLHRRTREIPPKAGVSQVLYVYIYCYETRLLYIYIIIHTYCHATRVVLYKIFESDLQRDCLLGNAFRMTLLFLGKAYINIYVYV